MMKMKAAHHLASCCSACRQAKGIAGVRRPSWLLATFLAMAACGGGSGVSAELVGDWTGTCSISSVSSTVALKFTVDSQGQVSGTLSSLDQGGTATLSGKVTDTTLSGSYFYPNGTSGTANGQMVSSGQNQFTANLTIVERGQQLGATCAFLRKASAVPPGVDALCNRAGECTNTSLSGADLDACRKLAAPIFQVVPDPAYTNGCLARLSCSQFQNQQAIQACVNLDPNSTVCSGASLHACSKAGTCTDIDCDTACGFVSSSFRYCGFEASRGYDICYCSPGGSSGGGPVGTTAGPPAIAPAPMGWGGTPGRIVGAGGVPVTRPVYGSGGVRGTGGVMGSGGIRGAGGIPIVSRPDAGVPQIPDAAVIPLPPDASIVKLDAAALVACARVSLLKTTNACDTALRGQTLFIADGAGGLKVADVSDAFVPKLVATMAPAKGSIIAVAADDKYVYAFDDRAGLLVVDVADLTAPTVIGTAALTTSSIPAPPAIPGQGSLAVSGSRAYVGGTVTAGICTVDISTPTAPALVGTCTSSIPMAGGFATQGNFLYATTRAQFMVVNVANPSGPLSVGSLSPAAGILHGSMALFGGHYALVPGTPSTAVIDLAVPTAPIEIADIALYGAAAATSGGYGLLASNNKLAFVDLGDPTAPTVVASCQAAETTTSGGRLVATADRAYLTLGTAGITVWQLFPDKLPRVSAIDAL